MSWISSLRSSRTPMASKRVKVVTTGVLGIYGSTRYCGQ
jgi:hypothetical protein